MGMEMKKFLTCFVGMLFGVLALAAWDAQYSAAQEAVDQGYTGPNPCSLLTLADATAAMGSRSSMLLIWDRCLSVPITDPARRWRDPGSN